MTLYGAVRSDVHDALKKDRDKLLAIVELIAIGASWAEFKKLYDDYKAGNNLSAIEERLEYAYKVGYQDGIRRGEELAMDRDKQ